TVGVVLGVGEGRGIGLVYVLFGLCIAAVAVVALRHRVLSRFDEQVPDAMPDDLLGVQTRQVGQPAPPAPTTVPPSVPTVAERGLDGRVRRIPTPVGSTGIERDAAG